MKKQIYKLLFLKLMGWKIDGTIDRDLKKCILMVMPHTSWHDFYVGLLTRGIINLEMNFIGKKELFRPPFGLYFRWMGGAPVDRSGNLNKVESIVKIFENRKEFRLAISPEGTRKKTNELKTGFYYIAIQANVPIVPVAFDFGTKTVKIGSPFYTTSNYEEDLKKITTHFKGVQGKITENGFAS